MGSDGWPFANADEFPGATTDPINGAKHVKDLYLSVQSDYDGRYAIHICCLLSNLIVNIRTSFTVPVLWDKKTSTIVNNESSEIIRMFNTAFNHLIPDKAKAALDLYPESLRKEIDEVNDWVYDTVNSTSSHCRGTCTLGWYRY